MNNENTLSTKSAQFPKCPKGVIQRLNLIPVKSHEGHTFYEYKTHTK